MIPGPEIMSALDGFSPRHKPIFTNVLRGVAAGDIAGAAWALGEKCAELRLQELPNPFKNDDPRRALWADGFERGLNGEYLEGPPEQGEMAPDFASMTKPQINDWLAENLEEAINQRLTKPDMISEARRLAVLRGYRVEPV